MEGPSLVIAAEEMWPAVGKKVLAVRGNSAKPISSLKGQRLLEIATWGKHLLLFFQECVVKVHFLLWGSYRVNNPREGRKPRMQLRFRGINIYFYACSIQFVEENVEQIYDWSADVMSPSWDAKKALAKARRKPRMLICDLLLDQSIFSGVGNIIKNEALFNMRLHPESQTGALTLSKLRALVAEAHEYSWKFFEWKRIFQLKKHWQIMRKSQCPRCGGKVTRKVTGQRKRYSFFCPRCQKLKALVRSSAGQNLGNLLK